MKVKALLFTLLLATLPLFAINEDKVIEFDRKTHDFGDILVSEGAVSCTFTFKNISSHPLVIHNVISSCGCTTPEWTREPVRPGESGFIKATFSNDQGPYPFDKTLTVYLSAKEPLDKPVVLRLRGVAHENRKELEELFETRLGPLGIRKTHVSIGYLNQGGAKSDNMQIANLSNNPVTVAAEEVSEGLEITVSPNPVPARSIARMTYTVDLAKVKKEMWGRKSFTAKLTANGKVQKEILSFSGLIKEGFENKTKQELARAASPEVEKSYFEFGDIRKGTVTEASFTIKNKGKEPLVLHTLEGQSKALTVLSSFPITIKPGDKAVVKVKYDSSKAADSSEVVEVLSAITNSPGKPILNLFITGNIFE